MMMVTIDTPRLFPMPGLPPCAIAGARAEIRRMADLPPSVERALRDAIGGGIAEAGMPFNPSDVVAQGSPPRTRFLRGYHVRDRWLVWVEQGGIGHSFRVLVFGNGPGGGRVAQPVPRGNNTMCAQSRMIAASSR